MALDMKPPLVQAPNAPTPSTAASTSRRRRLRGALLALDAFIALMVSARADAQPAPLL
ncbi:MAG TPA: hypothetical protein VGS80_00090 [Ktedonobacterales bacterium]|nr:hypothetical protein [Ktedonobacterales bacterium]